MKKGLLTGLLFSLILVLAACGGDDTASNDTSSDAGSDADVNIIATNFDFDKDEYVVTAGEEVTVALTNEAGHHGIAIEGLDVSIEGEGTATFTPTEPGEYKIYCSIMCGEGHGDMIATLVVQ
ncbi:cytochrome C oxidase subunit II [Ornithinibacillus halotolerans]|uniref:Cytochrome C oxidase subunit II n=1 Tax=Ornithinibacillus halotolerans TaxID=1274357 RepID=A0A916RWT7_9BACI|nr:cytochrome C oxidase subunit II [Ornithinibacillus halotolerans]GGA74576.1 hypothetical protein GCM10008025_17890 [Ornithinibacillus halotolerans]